MFRILTPARGRLLQKLNLAQQFVKGNPERILAVSISTSQNGSWSRITPVCMNRSSILEEKVQEGLRNKFENPDVPKDPEGRLIVYEGALKSQIRSLKFFSLTTSAMGLMMQPVILSKLAESSIGANIAAVSITGFFTFVTPILIHSIAKKYVTEIYYEPDTDSYTAATFNFFNRRKEIPFKLEEVVVPDVPGPFSTILIEQDTTNGKKQIPLFVAPNTFNDPVHYGRIMGFDKPINFHLDDEVDKIIKDKEGALKKN